MKNLTTVVTALLSLLVGVVPAAAQADLFGFVEYGTGGRITGTRVDSPTTGDKLSDYVLRELRLQLQSDLYGDLGEAHFKVDVLSDQIGADETEVAVREGYVKFVTFADRLEVRVGRQPTTWGTGDLLFINDLFPKDYVSFFSGRDDEYLKSPSDVLRFGLFDVLPFNVDLVLTPQFTPDVLPTGERLDFFNPSLAADPLVPSEELKNGEAAVRLNRYFGSWNWSLYGYEGFWKQPLAFAPDTFDMTTGRANVVHPKLGAYGASARGPLFGGVAWVEGGYYDSRDDDAAMDAFVPNSELRAMVGFERQWWSDFTGGLQFYWEGMQDHDEAVAARAATIDRFASDFGFDRELLERAFYIKDENRTLVTLRLRQQFLLQTLTAGLFTFYSPSDEDMYLRASLAYDYTDQLKLTVGANLFTADDTRTLFGMHEDNDNVYGRVRFTF